MEVKTKYPFAEVESKWRQARGERVPAGATGEATLARAKQYLFSWPGARGSETSLARRWVVADTFSRFQRHRAQAPFHPVAWNAFAPEALSAARETEKSPFDVSDADRSRVLEIALSLDLEEPTPVLDTSQPAWYRYSQWVFQQLFLRGLLIRHQTRFEACSRCGKKYRFGTVAACTGCQGEIRVKETFEWQVDVTPYADQLLADIDKADWAEEERAIQKDLLARTRGCEVTFPVSKMFDDEYSELVVFTTHVEMIFGATFLLVDPYHPILDVVVDPAYADDVARYRERLRKGAEPRISAARTGGFALNPASLRRIPILVSPLASVPPGEGALMAVPAHDRDLFDLAKRLKLAIREVIHNDKARFDSQTRLEEPWLGDGVLTNSGPFTSLASKVGRDRILTLLQKKGVSSKASRYRVSRLPAASPSPWGPPVPIIHCKRCGAVPVPESELPLLLPRGALATPAAESRSGEGESGLAVAKGFLRAACPTCGEAAARDTETLLPWLGNALALIGLVCPRLLGRVEGFRDLEGSPVEPGPAPLVDGEGAEKVPGGEDEKEAPPAAAPTQVLPEDVDIFNVDTAAEREVVDGADDPGEALDRSEAGVTVVTAGAAEGSGHVSPADVAAAPADAPGPATPANGAQTVPGDGGDLLRASRRTPAVQEAESDKPARAAGDDEEDDEDDDPTRAALRRLSKLRPFSDPVLSTLLPASAAFGPSRLGGKVLLATRFLMRFFHEAGHLTAAEPFARYGRVGEVLGREQGPAARGSAQTDVLDLAPRFGADALRLFMLGAGPPGRDIALDLHALERMRRFLDRIWHQLNLRREKGKFMSRKMLEQKHVLIHEVTRRLNGWKFHTAVAALMSFLRFLEDPETAPEDMDRGAIRTFLILLSPFAPCMARELWSLMGSQEPIETAPWPIASDELIHPPDREFVILVDGRVRDRMLQPSSLEPEKLESRALGRDRIRDIVGARKVEKVIVVPQKLVSIVLSPP